MGSFFTLTTKLNKEHKHTNSDVASVNFNVNEMAIILTEHANFKSK